MASEKRPSEWAYAIARDQRRDVETMAINLDAARAKGRREGLEEAAKCAWLHHRTCTDIAAEIRALIDKEPTA